MVTSQGPTNCLIHRCACPGTQPCSAVGCYREVRSGIAYQTLPMYNVRSSKQIFLALLSSSVMVQDPSSLRREQTISTASCRAMGHQENQICPSKASEVNRPVWCSISAHIDHLVATLHHLPKGFL